MPRITGLSFDRNGNAIYRRRVPTNIVGSVSAEDRKKVFGATTVYKKRLGTKDPKEAQRLAEEEAVRFRRLCDQLSSNPEEINQLEPQENLLSLVGVVPVDIAAITTAHYNKVISDELDYRKETRDNGLQHPDDFWDGKIIEFPEIDPFYDLLATGVFDDVVAYCFRIRTSQRVKKHAASIKAGNYESFFQIAQQFSDNEDMQNQIVLGLVDAETRALDAIRTGAMYQPPSLSEHHIHFNSNKLIAPRELRTPACSEALKRFIEEKRAGKQWVESTAAEVEKSIQEMMEVCGDRALETYRKSDVVDFRDVLSRLPKNARQMRKFEGMLTCPVKVLQS